MPTSFIGRITIFASLCLASTALAQLPDGIKSDIDSDVPAFKVRPGYHVSRAISNRKLAGSRFIQFSEDGKTLYVADQQHGDIYALRDLDPQGVYGTVTTFVADKPSVQGMDAHGGWLYFSQTADGSVSRARDTNGDGVADDVESVIAPGTLPKGGGHPFHGLLVTDKSIYVTTSDPQNMTEDIDSPRKTLYVFDADGKNKRVFCTGIRNTEKIRFRPGTDEIWGIDHGSDNFGKSYGEEPGKTQPITDLNPNEELNHLVEGGFYGHPFIMGNGVPRPEFSKRDDIVQLASKTTAPEWLIHAHWAVLGFTFLETDYFDADHKGDLFFCSHGSWNSAKPVGACVQRVLFDKVTGKPYGSLTIVDCAKSDGQRLARPVDCAEAPDGSILFTSDAPAGLFRITRSK